MKNRKLLILFFILLGIILYISGPKPKIDTTIQETILPQNLDHYLLDSESNYNDIIPGTEKTIFWANEVGERSELAFVYIHGFSASRGETTPLSEWIAKKFGANLFCTRLTGHGRSGDAMSEGSVNTWLNDVNEAYEIGKRIGDKVVFIGVSTGASALAWIGSQPEYSDIAGMIWISPNFGPKNKSSNVLFLPWGKQIAELVEGKKRSWEPSNQLHEKFWTNQYPTEALIPMIGLVKLARKAKLEKIQTPTLVLYSPKDEVVDPSLIIKNYLEIGSKDKNIISYIKSGDSDQHVLAGDALSPGSTYELMEVISDFVEEKIHQINLPKVQISTNFGNIVVEIDTIRAPISSMNFLRYVDENRFEVASFYRVVTMNNQPINEVKIEVIQGGIGFQESDLRLPSIIHEITKETSILHKDGTISMARLEPGTADSEIFICVNDQPELDFGGKRNPDGQGFAAFGQVVKGMDVVRKIQELPENGQMLTNFVKIQDIIRF